MKIFRAAFLLVATVVLAANADETNFTLTIEGITYSNVIWRSATPASVSIFHKSGAATIPLEKLPPDLQKRFGYDPQKAADYTGARRAAEAARQDALRKRQDEEAAHSQQKAQQDAEEQKQVAKGAEEQTAQVTAEWRANETRTKTAEEKFLASLGPVTMIKFSYANRIRRLPSGKYATSLWYNDDQGRWRNVYCQFPQDGLSFMKTTLHSTFPNARVVYGRAYSGQFMNGSGGHGVPTDSTAYWLVGIKVVSLQGKDSPSW
jgi:hypothetical protein